MRIAHKGHNEPASPQDNARILRRRVEWLDMRIKQARKEKRAAHFDISERDALVWALDELEHWIDLTEPDDNLKDF